MPYNIDNKQLADAVLSGICDGEYDAVLVSINHASWPDIDGVEDWARWDFQLEDYPWLGAIVHGYSSWRLLGETRTTRWFRAAKVGSLSSRRTWRVDIPQGVEVGGMVLTPAVEEDGDSFKYESPCRVVLRRGLDGVVRVVDVLPPKGPQR
jgi:hypothetical protein